MKKWLNETHLSGQLVELRPLSMSHVHELTEAVKDGRLWELWYTSAPKPDEVESYIHAALAEYALDRSLPFVVIRKVDNIVVGTTRYMNADSKNKRLEIGTTLYAQSAQRTGINTECKYLLLQYAFEVLECIAVEFRTHFHNTASRNAISRLGAKQDGILRNHSRDKLNCLRDTVVFSIIESEWNTVKHSLEYKMKKAYDKS